VESRRKNKKEAIGEEEKGKKGKERGGRTETGSYFSQKAHSSR